MKPQSMKQLRELHFSMGTLAGHMESLEVSEGGRRHLQGLLQEYVGTIENIVRLETLPRHGAFRLMSYAGNYQFHLALNGIYHADGFRYASDGREVVKIREEYPEEYEHKLLMRDGSLCWGDGVKRDDGLQNHKYPNVDNVLIPGSTAHAFPVNGALWELVSEHYRSYKAARKLADRVEKSILLTKYHVCLDGCWFNLELLLRFLRAVRHMGGTELLLDGFHAALAFCGERGTAAVMPLLPPEDEKDGEHYLYIDRETLAEKEAAQALEK